MRAAGTNASWPATTPSVATSAAQPKQSPPRSPKIAPHSTPADACLPGAVVDGQTNFISREHAMLGNAATGNERVTELRLNDGRTLSFGEVAALAGDYVSSVEELRQLAATPEGQDELRWARWLALGQHEQEPEPEVPAETKKTVRERYFNLAANNSNHFSHGGTAIATYKRLHGEALRKAQEAGATGNDAKFAAAVTDEACAQHFLSDTFSAGHVRAPVVAIREVYRRDMPDSIKQILRYATERIIQNLDERGDVPWYWPRSLITTKAMQAIERTAGATLDAFSLGDIVALACHNSDGEGLNVTSEVHASGLPVPGGFHWRAVGDGKMAPGSIGWRMAVSAMRVSRAELDRARDVGARTAKEIFRPYAATLFIPSEDAARNPRFVWRWGGMNDNMFGAVNACLRDVLVPQLRKHRPYPPVQRFDRLGNPDPDGAVVLHIGDAFEAFCREVEADGIAVLERAVKKPAVMKPRGQGRVAQGSTHVPSWLAPWRWWSHSRRADDV